MADDAMTGVHQGVREYPCPDCGSHRAIMAVDPEGEMFWQCECGSTAIEPT